ncbi:hypothetical protein CBR_g2890 [Chara braunii]|uniref:Right handed beta helix domain-containing protein n=1 Tax=Chara braunii TaxID=69332 RepID=A0A388KEB3_CHABU|nr:hypothetical protein CBR_g2890 [Chara braunii]|eukprot:GBG68346.1 hypothetical protein CBR_g2890 [Chara braunii]
MARQRFMVVAADRFSLHLAVQVVLAAAVLLGYGCQTASAHRVANEQQLAAAINGTAGVTVTITSDIVLTKELPTIPHSITIKGACGGRKCVIDGAGKYGIFRAYGSTPECSVTIENLLLRNAADMPAYMGKCNLKLKGVEFKNNKAGGVVIGLGPATWHIHDCLFEGNSVSGVGGAFVVTSSGRGRLERTTFKSNRAEENGGAVYIDAQPANTVGYVLDHVTFDSNTAGKGGGGMYVGGTSQAVVTVFVSRCKFTKNVATGGAGGGLALRSLMDARICHTSIADGGNKANGGQGNDLALLDGNYNPQMTVSFCPAHPKSLSLHVTEVANPPTVRHHCEVCELPK